MVSYLDHHLQVWVRINQAHYLVGRLPDVSNDDPKYNATLLKIITDQYQHTSV